METKFKEINTLSFIGNLGPKTERVWKEVDEENDIIHCQEKPERSCIHVAPLKVLDTDLPGDDDLRQIPIWLNENVRVELMHCRSSKGKDGHRPASEGDFELEEGDVLVVPPSVVHETAAMGQQPG